MSHSLAPGVTSIMAVARDRTSEPSTRAALGEGLDLIRQLVEERGRHQELGGQMDDAEDDAFAYDPPCPDE